MKKVKKEAMSFKKIVIILIAIIVGIILTVFIFFYENGSDSKLVGSGYFLDQMNTQQIDSSTTTGDDIQILLQNIINFSMSNEFITKKNAVSVESSFISGIYQSNLGINLIINRLFVFEASPVDIGHFKFSRDGWIKNFQINFEASEGLCFLYKETPRKEIKYYLYDVRGGEEKHQIIEMLEVDKKYFFRAKDNAEKINKNIPGENYPENFVYISGKDYRNSKAWAKEYERRIGDLRIIVDNNIKNNNYDGEDWEQALFFNEEKLKNLKSSTEVPRNYLFEEIKKTDLSYFLNSTDLWCNLSEFPDTEKFIKKYTTGEEPFYLIDSAELISCFFKKVSTALTEYVKAEKLFSQKMQEKKDNDEKKEREISEKNKLELEKRMIPCGIIMLKIDSVSSEITQFKPEVCSMIIKLSADPKSDVILQKLEELEKEYKSLYISIINEELCKLRREYKSFNGDRKGVERLEKLLATLINKSAEIKLLVMDIKKIQSKEAEKELTAIKNQLCK